MKPLCGLVLWMVGALALLSGYGFRSTLAQTSSGARKSAEELPTDTNPETRCRLPRATKDEFTTEEDRKAFDLDVASKPRLVEPVHPRMAGETFEHGLGADGMRLHLPLVQVDYDKALQHLTKNSGLEPKYYQLGVLVASREFDNEYNWASHERDTFKLFPSEPGEVAKIVEVIRNRKDTKGLNEKDAILIQFGRELFHQPKVSSKTFASMERLFGRRGTLAVVLIMGYYTSNAMLMRAYDQHLDEGTQRPFPDLLIRQTKNQ